MSCDNKFDKKAFLDFIELTQGKALNKKEMDYYIDGFCSYMQDHANTINEEIKSASKRQINTAKFTRIKRLINIGMSIISFGIFVSIFISNINLDLISVPGILFMLVTLIVFLLAIKDIKSMYIHSRNTRNIKVGHMYIYDINSIHHSFNAKSDIYDKKNPFDDAMEIPSNVPSYPTMMLVTNIGYDFLYCVDPTDGMIFRLPISEANYLTCIDDGDFGDKELIIRYPYELPTFTYEDCKILEACLILAHTNDKENLYSNLANTLAKIRFYADEPYGTFTKEKAEEYSSKIQKSIDFLNHLKKGYYKNRRNLFDDNDDIFGDAD